MNEPTRFEHLRRSKDIVVELGRVRASQCLLFDEHSGWPKYTVKGVTGSLPDGICKIDETSERGITLRQLLVTWEHVKRNCIPEGWTASHLQPDGTYKYDGKGKPLTPETVTLYDLCEYVIKPATEVHKCSFVELVTGVGDEIVRRCPVGHVPMARTEVHAGEKIACTKCAAELKRGAAFWVCHRCGEAHQLCDVCAPAPSTVSCAELQRPLWFISHWYGPCRSVSLLSCRWTCRVRAGGASPLRSSSRASCSTGATGTSLLRTTTRGSTIRTGCARTRTTSGRTPPSLPVLVVDRARLSCVCVRLSGDVTDDPAASSFAKAMALSVGTLSVLDTDGICFKRIWCALAFHASALARVALGSATTD